MLAIFFKPTKNIQLFSYTKALTSFPDVSPIFPNNSFSIYLLFIIWQLVQILTQAPQESSDSLAEVYLWPIPILFPLEYFIQYGLMLRAFNISYDRFAMDFIMLEQVKHCKSNTL